MQGAPERIWAWVYNLPYSKHNGYRCWTPFEATFKPWVIHDWPGWKFLKSRTTEYYQNQTEYTRTDLCITEVECQRRIDAAIDDLMKALRAADTYIDIGHFQMARNITRNAIRARGQK